MSENPETPTTEKEPRSFTEFIADALSSVKKTIAIQRRRYIDKGGPKEAKITDLHFLANRGGIIGAFLQSTAWTEHIKPFLDTEMAGSIMKPWSPGDPYAPPAVRAEFFFSSGKYWANSRIESVLAGWTEEGKQAAETLNRETERRKKFDKKEKP